MREAERLNFELRGRSDAGRSRSWTAGAGRGERGAFLCAGLQTRVPHFERREVADVTSDHERGAELRAASVE